MRNHECLKIKGQCHITLDQVSDSGAYALVAIESMAAGHPVLCGQSNFWMSYLPENPIVAVTPENIEERLEELIVSPDLIDTIGQIGKLWARRYHSPEVVLRQYLSFYDLAIHGNRLLPSSDCQLIEPSSSVSKDD